MKKPRAKKDYHLELRMVQEKATGLFFNHENVPDCERDQAWMFTKREALAAIRAHYGGDHGVDLVNILPCERSEYRSWCGRKGGMHKSAKKTWAVRKNARLPRSKREDEP